MDKFITFLFLDTGSKSAEKGFLPVPNIFENNKYVDIPQDTLYKNLENALKSVREVFDHVQDGASKFAVDEIELGLNVGADGKVSFVALEGAASVSTSIKVKLKRRETE